MVTQCLVSNLLCNFRLKVREINISFYFREKINFVEDLLISPMMCNKSSAISSKTNPPIVFYVKCTYMVNRVSLSALLSIFHAGDQRHAATTPDSSLLATVRRHCDSTGRAPTCARRLLPSYLQRGCSPQLWPVNITTSCGHDHVDSELVCTVKHYF
jgi:hypothetical protein